MKCISCRFTLLCVVMMLCSGCGRTIQWGIDTFYQGVSLKEETGEARKYIRSITVYDQLTTEIMVDALWLSKAVRASYVALHARMHGLNGERKNALLRRQMEETKHFIVFYVLVPRSIALDEEHSPWRLLLRVGDAVYAPAEIKSIEIGPEYKEIFGTVLTRFKAPYQVKFEALDAEDVPLLAQGVACFDIIVRTTAKEAVLTWQVPAPTEDDSVADAEEEDDADEESSDCKE